MPPRPTSISADLGPLKAPWVAWCAQHQTTPSDALRQIVRKVIGHPPPPSPGNRNTVPHRPERATAQCTIRFTPSEYQALKSRAAAEGVRPMRWVIAMVRTILTHQPRLLPPELAALAQSTNQLLALGRNLNQIAKALNTSPQNRPAFPVELISALSERIQTHTQLVSTVMQSTMERWKIK